MNIRVTLRWLQVLDKLEPWYKSKGEFVFWTRVTSGEHSVERRFPEEGHYPISDHPRWNRLDHLNKVMYEGEAGHSLSIEVRGVETDRFSSDDELEHRGVVFPVRDQTQPPAGAFRRRLVVLHHRQQGFLGGGFEAVRHRGSPPPVRCERARELLDRRQGGGSELRLHPAAAGLRELHDQGHENGHQPA